MLLARELASYRHLSNISAFFLSILTALVDLSSLINEYCTCANLELRWSWVTEILRLILPVGVVGDTLAEILLRRVDRVFVIGLVVDGWQGKRFFLDAVEIRVLGGV